LHADPSGRLYSLLYALIFFSISPAEEESFDISAQDRSIISQVSSGQEHNQPGEFRTGASSAR
jgi:hypothetical protein